MIIIFKELRGDYEDTHVNIVALLDVQTNLTEEQLKKEYNNFLCKLMDVSKIPIYEDKNGRQPHVLAVMNGYVNQDKKEKKYRKLHKNILNDNSFMSYVKTFYIYKEITDFIELYN